MSMPSVPGRLQARRPGCGAAALLALLVVALLGVIVLNSAAQPDRPFDPDSPAWDGTRALWLWLNEMGYQRRDISRASFDLPEDGDVLFLFYGDMPYSSTEAWRIARWVEAGGTAVFVGGNLTGLSAAFTDYNPVWSGTIYQVEQMQPLLPSSVPIWNTTTGVMTFQPHPSGAAVPVAAAPNGYPTIKVRQRGEGTVWYLSDAHPLTNESLRDLYQAAVVPAILRTVPPGGTVLFDAYHFYGPVDSDSRIATLQDLLYGTSVGRALLFALALGLLYWLLAGRRLGPPVPPTAEIRRREAAEYVRAMAGLKRRAHAAPDVARHHRQRLKSALARTRALDPRVDDVDFTRRLRAHAVVDPSLDPDTLAEVERLLAALQAPADEHALVAAAARVDAFLEEHR